MKFPRGISALLALAGAGIVVDVPRTAAHCPRCRAAVTDLFEVGPEAPRAGSFTICWQCDELLRFDTDRQLRQLTDEDKRTLDKHPSTVADLEILQAQIIAARNVPKKPITLQTLRGGKG